MLATLTTSTPCFYVFVKHLLEDMTALEFVVKCTTVGFHDGKVRAKRVDSLADVKFFVCVRTIEEVKKSKI